MLWPTWTAQNDDRFSQNCLKSRSPEPPELSPHASVWNKRSGLTFLSERMVPGDVDGVQLPEVTE